MKFFTLWFCVLFFMVRTPDPALSQPSEEHHTSIRLLANVKSIRPGQTFMAGILMNMDPGWHTYWKNAGDAGLAPEISWTLPVGITAGEILWPLPRKYVEPGDLLAYGYEKENLLMIPMKVDETFASSSATLKADVDWLECEQVCIPGSGSASLTLPTASAAPSPDNEVIFNRFLGQVPRPFSAGGDVKLDHSIDRNGLTITLTSSGQEEFGEGNDFYPELAPGLEVGRTEVAHESGEARLTIPLRLFEKGMYPPSLRGVVVYTFKGSEKKAATVEFPLSAEAVSKLRLVGEKGDGSLLDRDFVIDQESDGGGSLGLYLLFALVGGLLLNVMPCVLPVIGLKVFGLVRMGGEDPGKVRRLGLLFALGILASFLVLAFVVIILKSAGEQVGWGFQFQEPAFVVIMSAVVMAFGLSLFGVFEIQLPAKATIGVGDLVTKVGAGGSSSLGSFSEGVFATILATPCTAPILGTALGFAFSQPSGIILLMFSAVAIGMAVPYLLLTVRPAWMKILPKPGEWMVTAKQFMGFLMMATLLWLLYVLGKQLGMEAVIWTGAFLLTVCLACWIVGRFATLSATRGRFFVAWTVAVLSIILGWVTFQQPILEAKDILAGPSTSSPSDEIQWEPFSLNALEQELSSGNGVLIDFTAEWCLTCKVNEKTVLADEDVVRKVRESGLVPLKADWTRRDPDITRLLNKFGRSGVPLYVVFPAGKPDQPIVLPEVITTGIVLEASEKALR